jgi:hypothetical protein
MVNKSPAINNEIFKAPPFLLFEENAALVRASHPQKDRLSSKLVNQRDKPRMDAKQKTKKNLTQSRKGNLGSRFHSRSQRKIF